MNENQWVLKIGGITKNKKDQNVQLYEVIDIAY